MAPERVEETLEIRRRIQQPMAGGEILFGVAGFAPLCRSARGPGHHADVKHCGGLLELTRIAAMAEADGVEVAPHNPSGPVSTAASVQVCAVLRNFRLLEFQWGEVDWRREVVSPPERSSTERFVFPIGPGFGIELNDRALPRRIPSNGRVTGSATSGGLRAPPDSCVLGSSPSTRDVLTRRHRLRRASV